MILSSRKIPPTMALRRNPSSLATTPTLSSFGKHELTPKHGLMHLLDSPLPSPALPSIVPRHGKKAPRYRLRTCLRIFLRWSLRGFGLCLAYWLIWTMIWTATPPAAVSYLTTDADADIYRKVSEDTMTEAPATVVVIQGNGRPKWTVSIPSKDSRPLRPSEYAAICRQSEQVSNNLHGSTMFGSNPSKGSNDYHYAHPNFIDVAEAEAQGLLPMANVGGSKSKSAKKEPPVGGMKVCKKSLTYVLESTHAGLGVTLMGLWASYGLAQQEGRAFFIDDTNWAYGKYNTFFRPPPVPSCLPPPPHHRIPCPHQARHLLVSASTTAWTFGAAFDRKLQDQHTSSRFRQKPLFALLRAGHDALFHLSEPDAEYASTRMTELISQRQHDHRPTIGLHVRRGDRHPLEYQYENSYIPLETYMSAAQDLMAEAKIPVPDGKKGVGSTSPHIILASDDPDVYDAPELQPAVRAQSQIVLASKRTLDAAQGLSELSSGGKFVEGNIGWEGGFFSNVFWNLGGSTDRAAAARDDGNEREQQQPNEMAVRLREFLGRAYLLDLKLLSSSADGVVCGVSSVGCRLLAVMMGWERSMVEKRWKNVDGGYAWRAF